MLNNTEELTRARNEYAYPPFCLTRSSKPIDESLILWGMPVDIYGPDQFDEHRSSGFSSFELDQYHCKLLRSDDDEKVLLGVASITFWGFALGKGRFTINRALARAKIVAGLGKRAADAPETITRAVRNIATFLDGGKRQEAIIEAMGLRHHGLAFASKLLAFSNPATESVYDEVISLRLKCAKDPRLTKLHVLTVGQHHIAEKASAYEGWAELCFDKAAQLNLNNSQWRDWDGKNRAWRAVDVERAFFSLGRERVSHK